MTQRDDRGTDLTTIEVASVGRVVQTDNPWEPYRLVDRDGTELGSVSSFLKDLQAAGRPASTQRSYGLALLRWFRFLWAVGVAWDRAGRGEARDFSRWMQVSDKPHGRRSRPGAGAGAGGAAVPAPAVNAVTRKRAPGPKYAPRTTLHSETVVRMFYDFHRDIGTGPMVNPFPLARERRAGRANIHHNPMDPYVNAQKGLYRPTVAARTPRNIPDEHFNELFTHLRSNRDRALIAFFVSTGARAAELLGATVGDVDPGQQLITVIRKGSRALQQLPASPDAFVWLRLYQADLDGLVADGRDQPLWWTTRRPYRALTYPAAHRMFERVNAGMGSNWTLHDLRHTAAHRMARDPNMPLTDVQWVLGHAQLSTTQIYLNPVPAEVFANVTAFHARRAAPPAGPAEPPNVNLRYSPETLNVLFRGDLA
jgi:integrase